MIDIFICAYLRQLFTGKTINYLKSRTKTPYRLFLIDNGGNEEFEGEVDYYLKLPNLGVHAAWNIALSLAENKYFITSDNDIYVPDLEPDWLSQVINFMNERPDYGAISLHPHIFIGAATIDPKDKEDVKERNMCGAVMRIMRTSVIQQTGGWERRIGQGRNNEERVISSRIHDAGYKTGICARIRAYHPFGDNWGYPEEFTPEMQKHNPELKDYVKQFDQPQAYDERTWLPK